MRPPRFFLHHDITVAGEHYEVHPGARLGSAPTIYHRTRSGLRLVDRAVAEMVVHEWATQQQRAIGLAEAAKRAGSARKPVTMRDEAMWRTARRKLAGWWNDWGAA